MRNIKVNNEAIRKLRISKGFTQGELAEAAGMTKQAISKMETGLSIKMGINRVAMIAKKLEVDMRAISDHSSHKSIKLDITKDIYGMIATMDMNELKTVFLTCKLIEASRDAKLKP